jgi:hypothetical protein
MQGLHLLPEPNHTQKVYEERKDEAPYFADHNSRSLKSSSSLSCDRSIASSKLSSPKSAIQSFPLQLPVSSCFLKAIQQLLTAPS